MSTLERVLYGAVIVCLLAAIVSLRSSNAELTANPNGIAKAEVAE
jgi:hypothetical protein